MFIGFGSGSDGVLTVDSPSTMSPYDSACSGTSGSNSLTATNASFAEGQLIFIHQIMGTGYGKFEFRRIASYTTGTITTDSPLTNTYTNSGSSKAQVIVVQEYSSASITSTLTCKAFDGTVGGVAILFATGTIDITGAITANGGNGSNVNSTIGGRGTGGGLRGGNGDCSSKTNPLQGYTGEGSGGPSVAQYTANGSGGGGGDLNVAGGHLGGGGGGYASAGNNGTSSDAPSRGNNGVGGLSIGIADLTEINMGGGGGGGAKDNNLGTDVAGGGGAGGGIILLIADKITGTGSITSNGGNGGSGTVGASIDAGGGGGSGGSILLIARELDLDSMTITANAGSGGAEAGSGSVGRIRLESCTLTGSTTPTASTSVGGHNFCGILGGMV